MKRFLVIPIMFLYIFAVSGVMIHVHYCGEVLESWNMFSKSNGCDEGCGDETKNADDCCKDKVITSKTVQDQYFADAFKLKISDNLLSANLSSEYVIDAASVFTNIIVSTNQTNAPPGLWQNIPLYKLHARLTYYG